MRAKEFIMKDAYSFDATDEAAQPAIARCTTLHKNLSALRIENVGSRSRYGSHGGQVFA